MKWIVLFSLLTLCNCSGKQDKVKEATQRDFTIIEDRLYLPVSIDGRPSIQLLFDTGTAVGCLISETLAREYSDTIPSGTDLGSFDVEEITIHGFPLGTQTIHHIPEEGIGVVAPSNATDRRIWCFDMDNEKFSIHQNDTLPEGALVYPIIFASYQGTRIMPFVNIPLTIRSGADTIKTDYLYMLDTGTPYGFCMTDPPQEFEAFVSGIQHWEIEDMLSLRIPSRRLSDFSVDIDFAGIPFKNVRCAFDTGSRSYANEYRNYLPASSKPVVGTLGMRILKCFNMILDLKNARLILTPTNRKFASKPPNRTGFWTDSFGAVTRIRRNDQAYEQGLRLGDTVISVNGIIWRNIPKSSRDSIGAQTQKPTVWEIKGSDGPQKIVID